MFESWYALGKIIVFTGIMLLILGGLIMTAGKLLNFGHLPGDIFIRRGNFTFYFPLLTCIILSVLLTIIFNFLLRR
jgi:hypothetical protein